MNIFNTKQKALLLACVTMPLPLLAAIAPGGSAASSTDYTAKPPAVIESADPLILIDLSVELTQQAEAYTDGNLSYGPNTCPDRKKVAGKKSGICYFDNYDYIGYFDPKKCYLYDNSGSNTGVQTSASPYTGPGGGIYRGSTPNPLTKPDRHFFKPSSMANSDYTCTGSNEWSGNYLNWATMSAIDEFRAAMTGGARLIDTAGASAETLLVNNYHKSWGFVPKAIGRDGDKITKNGVTFDNDSSQLTPFDENILVAINHAGALEHKVRFYNGDGDLLGEYNVIVKVCDPSVSLEDNCVAYSDASGNTWYKPEGLLQKNAVKMRYALSSYIAENGTGRDGGVMRALAKYIGYVKPADNGGLEVNEAAEVAEDGRFIYNPDNQSIVLGRVTNSGLINYINNFGLGPNGYKGNDPVAELYYESLKYFKGLAPTAEYSNNMTDARYDNFPIYNKKSQWDASKPLADVCQTTYKLYVGDQYSHADGDLPGECVSGASAPSGADPEINTCSLTNTVGTLEGYHAGSLGSRKQSNNSGHWIAGLAYYARTHDLRPEDGDQTIKTFMVDTAEYKPSGGFTEEDNKLWLAAKFGGFEDTNDDKNPNKSGPSNVTSSIEWDADGDGVPDTYTVANQPDNLVKGLNEAFAEFSKGSASSSAAAVVSNSAGGTGAIYQALYEPRVTGEGAGEIVDWTGTIISFFIDDKSRFREDCLWDSGAQTCVGEGNKILDDTDPEIKFRATIDSKTSEKIVVYDRYSISSGALISSDNAFKEMGVIFDAAKSLSNLDDSKIVKQRDYADNATEGRHIITSLNGSDTVAFDSTTFVQLDTSDSTIDPRRLLGFDSTTEFDSVSSVDLGEALVNYIRGQDQSIGGWRSRKITTKVGATTEVKTKRMGDIINSAPVVVGRPNDIFDVRYADSEYAYFAKRYADRRQVAYVGANDGMLHAFNAGFYGIHKTDAKPTFATSPEDLSSGAAAPTSPERHPLGAELWSYVPYNLLPHLQWLKELEYPHVYYMDGDVQSFDVNIFDDCGGAVATCTHPYGWGTIIVATMRFGGGEITVNTSSDNPADGVATMRSAIVVFDVTDPEQEPKLIAEITHPELGYTTSKPIVYKAREADTNGNIGGSTDNWYLVFGSGPAGNDQATSTAALEQAVSNQNARLFGYDLKNKSFVSGYAPKVLSETNSFVGDLAVMDWDSDYVDDAIYFGTVGGSVASPTGKLKRFVPSGTPEIVDMLNGSNSNQPYTAAPKPVLDRRGEAWVFAGTGRFFVADDILSSQQQSFHGIKENTDKSSYTTTDKSDLVDTTDILVFVDGSATAPDTVSDAIVASPSNLVNKTATTYSQVRSIVSNSPHGWFINLGSTEARNLLSATLIRDILLFDEYTPSGNTCAPAGTSRLFNLNMLSGTPSSDIIFATDPSVTNTAGSIQVLGGIDMGDGQIIGISAHRDTAVVGMGGGSGSGGFRMESNTATIGKIPFGRRSWREIPYQ